MSIATRARAVLGARSVGTIRTGLRLEVVRLRTAAAGEHHAAPSRARENLATLYAAVEQGFASPLPAFVKDELEREADDPKGHLEPSFGRPGTG